MSEHTKEPWSFQVDDADGVGRLLNDLNNNEIAHVFDHEAGRRIAACVNRLAQFKTEDIENPGFESGMYGVLMRITQQRDDLLAAMKYLQEHRLWINSHAKAVIESAIAKVQP